MRSILALSLVLVASSGCVSYDKDDALEDTGIAGDDGSFHENPDDGTEEPGEEDLGYQLVLDPPQAEQGETFIGYITTDSDDFDLTIVQDLRFVGDVELIGFDNRGDELVLSMAIDEQAVTGDIDIALILDDQSTVWFNGALTIFEAGSGNSAADYGDDGSGGSDDCP